MKRILSIIIIGIFICSGLGVTASPFNKFNEEIYIDTENAVALTEDFDPLVDITVTVEILTIRALDEIDLLSDPDFFVKVFIDETEFVSPTWNNEQFLYDLNWSATLNVPDNIENVEIVIQLWDQNPLKNKPCDISGDINQGSLGYDVYLTYNIKTGHWTGDDTYIDDPSGYGRLNGCDDGSFYKNERDCEVWFTIYQNDYDGDNIPYWAEVNAYGTDPKIDNTGEDEDSDDIPIEWEHKWRYNPNMWDDHKNLDTEKDGLNNWEEYLTSQWGSDPFRKDLFLELDYMEEGPRGENSTVPEKSKELLRTAYDCRNIVFHLDDGCMGGGGEVIPFDKKTYRQELFPIYQKYFLHNDSNNWRRSVFRYVMSIYNHYSASGIAFVGEYPILYWHARGTNTFQISSKAIGKIAKRPRANKEFVYACIIMHETGHALGIDKFFPLGCDSRRTMRPWQLGFWLFRNYKSCMNYRYTFYLLDYSDGSHGRRDYNDWENLDFTFFECRN